MIPETVATLKTLQPYFVRIDNERFHGLTIVEEFSNTNKHLELVIMASGLRDPVITKTVNGSALRPEEVVGDVKNGAKITADPFPREVEMKIEGITLRVVGTGEDGGYAELPSTLDTII
jgi:hypothetical protein